MSLVIRPAVPDDLPALEALFAAARRFMAAAGNPRQWANGYPGREDLAADIRAGKSYICEEDGELLASFFFDRGPCPEASYRAIDGAWLQSGPYGVVHRLAVADAARGRGVAGRCLAWCFARSGGDLRADTHADNRPMQRTLEKNGFSRRGTVVLARGGARWAYEKTGDV